MFYLGSIDYSREVSNYSNETRCIRFKLGIEINTFFSFEKFCSNL